jgi:hypothetical protein
LAIQGMDAEQKKTLDAATNIAGVLGEQGIEVARILALGGPKNAEDQKAVVAMPEEQRVLIQRLLEIKGGGEEATAQRNAIRIQMLLEAERSASNKDLNRNLSNLVQSQNDQLVQMGRTQMSINQTGNTISQMRNEYQEALQGGKEGKDPRYEGLHEAMSMPNIDVRIFGKPTTRPYRRMAVALAKGDDALARARASAAKIKVITD